MYHPLALRQWNLFQQKSSILALCIVCVTVTRTAERGRLTWRVASLGVICLMSFIFVLSPFSFLPYFLFNISWNKLFGPVGGSCHRRLEVPASSRDLKIGFHDSLFMMFLRMVLEIGHHRFLPHPFQFVIHYGNCSELLIISWRKPWTSE